MNIHTDDDGRYRWELSTSDCKTSWARSASSYGTESEARLDALVFREIAFTASIGATIGSGSTYICEQTDTLGFSWALWNSESKRLAVSVLLYSSRESAKSACGWIRMHISDAVILGPGVGDRVFSRAA